MAKNVPVHVEGSLAAETIVGHSVRIEGELVSEGDIKIEGAVHGSVKTTQNLFVGPTAKIEANVQAGSATVAGTIMGNLKIAGLLIILQTGRITGDIDCAQLGIEEGAYFSGKCAMTEQTRGKAAATNSLIEEEP